MLIIIQMVLAEIFPSGKVLNRIDLDLPAGWIDFCGEGYVPAFGIMRIKGCNT